MTHRPARVAFPVLITLVGSTGCLRDQEDAGDGSPTTKVAPPSSGGQPPVAVPASAGAGLVGAGGSPSTLPAGGSATTGGQLTASGGSAGGADSPSIGGGGFGGNAATNDGELPCDVLGIARASCGTCHGSTTQFGAPFPLASAADFRTHGAAILRRVADDQRPMPPPPNERLTTAQRAALEAYIGAGAPASTCSQPIGEGPGVPTMPTTPTDPDVTCYRITARDSQSDPKFSVPTTPDLYQCFEYALPWGSKNVQVVRTTPITDNAKVLHHWILYNTEIAVQDGRAASCIGAHPNAAMISGWAPGGQGLEVPSDVGVGIMPGGFVLETHYNNKEGVPLPDASGVEICVTEKLRPNTAAVHWLGTQSLNKITATGTCRPVGTMGDVTILSSSPHMHLQGRHLKTVINRAGGSQEVLIDKPFDFNTQISYATRAVVKSGDTLTTTCTYATPTPFGEGTNQEMCYNFVLAYPAGGLAQPFQLLRKYDCSGF